MTEGNVIDSQCLNDDSIKSLHLFIPGEMKHALLDGDVINYDSVCSSFIRWFSFINKFSFLGSWFYKTSNWWYSSYLCPVGWTFDYQSYQITTLGQRHKVTESIRMNPFFSHSYDCDLIEQGLFLLCRSICWWYELDTNYWLSCISMSIMAKIIFYTHCCNVVIFNRWCF